MEIREVTLQVASFFLPIRNGRLPWPAMDELQHQFWINF
jgi:hypothetical protein